MDSDENGATGDLQALLQSIQASVENTQKTADFEYVKSRFENYFAPDGTPLVKRVKVPDPRGTGWREIEVPLLALVPLSSMRIKELTVEMTTTVTSLLRQNTTSDSPPLVTSVKLDNAPQSGKGLADIRVVFTPATTTNSQNADIAIRFLEPEPETKVFVRVNDPAIRGTASDGKNQTLDTRTGLKWLDFSITDGRSTRDITTRLMDKNDELFDYRYARSQEVITLLAGYGLSSSGKVPETSPALSFMQDFGTLTPDNLAPATRGLWQVSETLSQYCTVTAEMEANISRVSRGGWNPDMVRPNRGHFLIKQK